MKNYNLILLLLAICLFSCNDPKDDEENWPPITYEEVIKSGVFQGEINHEYVSLENKSGHKYVSGGTKVVRDERIYFFSISMQSEIFSNTIKVGLIPQQNKTLYLIDKGFDYFSGQGCGIGRRYYNDEFYHPLKEPVKVYIDKITYDRRLQTEFIEGRIEGVLYNIDNMEDSVTIKKGKFCYHSSEGQW